MKLLWSKELRCTTKGANKFYKLEVLSKDGAIKMEYLVRASWAGIGKKPNMQEKGTYPTQSEAITEAEILAKAKAKKGYKVYKTKTEKK
ncbi:MAG: WGR domain-containing protein, partial [Candidatus Bathyarchaeota archaeon]|nr:WGR domain-containing protein [Candidatus Bathyarchaeota archaeon]